MKAKVEKTEKTEIVVPVVSNDVVSNEQNNSEMNTEETVTQEQSNPVTDQQANQNAAINAVVEYQMNDEDKAELSKLNAAILGARKEVITYESTLVLDSIEVLADEKLLAFEATLNAAREAKNKFNEGQKEKKAAFDLNVLNNNAFADLMDKFGISKETIEAAIKESKDNDKSTLKASFVRLFGQLPKNVAMEVTGKDISKSTSTDSSTNGSTAIIPEGYTVNSWLQKLMDEGSTEEMLINAGHDKGRIRNVLYKIGYSKQANGKYAASK
jgi:hypothetical protein